MPSTKDPTLVVNPGPGRLPAGVVPAGALLFPPGGGAGAALTAHITDPVDAHMASAIGINPFYPPTGDPILSSVGGVVDGENVLDFIEQFKDLIPVRPNSIGFNVGTQGTSGIPDWGQLNALGVGTGTAVISGYADPTPLSRASHFIVPNTAGTFALNGLVFPADRGVLALYLCTETGGNYYNAGFVTLVGAISLNAVAPAGIPDSAFNDSLRHVQQPNYTGTNVGLDIFDLSWRLPYLSNYSAYPGTPFGPYPQNFFGYQLAIFSLVGPLPIAAGNNQSFLLVHWKETYATSLAAIQPANLTAANLTAAKCYSAVPTVTADYDDPTKAVFNVNRHFVFRDTQSATAPSLNTFTTANSAGAPLVYYSGVQFINNAALHGFSVTLSANNLFANAYQLGTTGSLIDIPFYSANNPIDIDFSEFGGAVFPCPYDVLRKQGIPGNYSIINPPQPADIGEYFATTQTIPSPTTAFTPHKAVGYSSLSANFYRPFTSNVGNVDASQRYLYNTFSNVGGSAGSSTSTFEGFVDEHYRVISTHVPLSNDPVLPAAQAYVSTTLLSVDTGSAQIITNNLVYPQEDFSNAALYYPVGPNYSTLPGSDGANNLRRHLRAFDTGIARNTGKLRIRFLAGYGTQSSFTTNAAYDGIETTGHLTGGMIIQLQVPGVTGWLDIGRALGDPGLATSDFYGCSTGVSIVGPDIFVSFQTTAFTANNGFGEFPLWARISLLNNAAGLAIRLDEVEWLPP